MLFALLTPEVERGSRGLEAVFAQPDIWRSPSLHRMIYEVVLFGQLAPEVFSDPERWQVATAHRLPRGINAFSSAAPPSRNLTAMRETASIFFRT